MWEEKLSALSRGSLSVVSLVMEDIFKASNDPREFLPYMMTLKATSLRVWPTHMSWPLFKLLQNWFTTCSYFPLC